MTPPRTSREFTVVYDYISAETHTHVRREVYNPQMYFAEFQSIVNQYNRDPLITKHNNLGGPSVCCLWNVSEIIDLGYINMCSCEFWM